jgi:hypothetical protein
MGVGRVLLDNIRTEAALLYDVPFEFTGKIDKLIFKLELQQQTARR